MSGAMNPWVGWHWFVGQEDEEADEDAIQLGDTFANETLVAEEDPHM
jgi:hypothetical protein